MAATNLLKSSGITALAAGLAMLATPIAAQAQDGGRGRWQGGDSTERVQRNVEGADAREGGQARQWRREQQRSSNPDGNARPGWRTRGASPDSAGNTAGGWGGSRRVRSVEATPLPPAPVPQVTMPQNRVPQSGGRWEGRQSWSDNDRPREVERDRHWRDSDRRDNDRRGDGRLSDHLRDRDRHDRSDRWRNNDRRDDNWRDNRWNDSNRSWNREWRRDHRYDWYSWRNANRSHYRMGRYYAPYRNYYYRRLTIGFYLDNLFFSSRYWIDDPWSYRLPEAYGPYRWVRYYDDALLVNIYSGEVVDVIYDFFW